jgi:hypothetical protein
MKAMDVKQLIEQLSKIEDQTLPITITKMETRNLIFGYHSTQILNYQAKVSLVTTIWRG